MVRLVFPCRQIENLLVEILNDTQIYKLPHALQKINERYLL